MTPAAPEFTSIMQCLAWRARHQPERVAFEFLYDDAGSVAESRCDRWTYKELYNQALVVAGRLEEHKLAAGERLLLVYPAGLSFVAAFYGSLIAGVVPVPVPPPKRNQGLERWQHVVRDAKVAGALTTADLQPGVETLLAEAAIHTSAPICLATDTDISGENVPTGAAFADLNNTPRFDLLAFLQYTSGSTSQPKGVMITHGNMLANLRQIEQQFDANPDDRSVSWLPHYHDMGLIGSVLSPVYSGYPVTLMAPASFLRRPVRWLEAASHFKATGIGGPNFAFEHCARKATPEQVAAMDLSRLKLAYNGAEQVRAETLERFTDVFSPAGFRAEVFFPCFGMAEATLFVTGTPLQQLPRRLLVAAGELRQFDQPLHLLTKDDAATRPVTELVSCGKAVDGLTLSIVHPHTQTACIEGQVGEIWFAGDNVAAGYWENTEATTSTFGARVKSVPNEVGHLAGDQSATFFRSGDLGFIHEGELYLTGRLKELIVIRGENYYPNDIEVTACAAHDALTPGACAAFGIDIAGEERLGLVLEVERTALKKLDAEAVMQAVRQAVTATHELQVAAITLLKPGRLPKTPSGKIQRYACRLAVEHDDFKAVVAHWQYQPAPEEPINADWLDRLLTMSPARRRADLTHWLQQKVAQGLAGKQQSDRAELPGIDENFLDLGLDSLMMVELKESLEKHSGRQFPATLIFEYPTIAALASYLTQSLSGEVAATESGRISTANQSDGGAGQERIAIIGMAARFPGAEDIDAFWTLLKEGRSGFRSLSEDELKAAGESPDYYQQPDYVRTAASFDDPTGFDARFFGYSPREAELLDPQQRVFLECAWHALEEAGYDSEQTASRIGVYGGAALSEYLLNLHNNAQVREHSDVVQLALGNLGGLLVNRASYHLGLDGPSVGLQTSCSTSLVAVHHAVQALRNDECEMALAGAAAVSYARPRGYLYKPEGIAAPDGLCRPFDAEGKGTVFGNGVGVVALKRLSDALHDGDHIHAVICGSAINNDGADKVGLTAPSVSGQVNVIKAALANAGVDAQSISYVESHGTATVLGDPVEVEALNRAYSAPDVNKSQDAQGYRCALGSVKSNVGHLDAAAGMAGLIKTVLSIKHQTLPASLNFTAPNPNIDFDNSPFYVNAAISEWQAEHSQPLRAGVSSFGMGGTNAHIILEQAPSVVEAAEYNFQAEPECDSEPDREIYALPLSAMTQQALNNQRKNLAEYLQQHPQHSLRDIAYTLQVGRRALPCRHLFFAENREQALDILQADADMSLSINNNTVSDNPGCVFMFSGQGSQYAGMAQQLYAHSLAFREAINTCAEYLRDGIYVQNTMDLFAVLWPEQADAEHIHRTEYTQPALFAVEYALAKHWLALGIEPQALMGHSVGEYVAACLAGVFTLRDAIRLVAERGRLMQSCEPGAMLSVLLSEQQAAAFTTDVIEIAVVNGPQSCVLAGPVEAIQQLSATMEKRHVACKLVKTSHAFHSAMMAPILADFETAVSRIALNPPSLPLVSNVTGTWLTAAQAIDPAYWASQLRNTVRFKEGISTVMSLPNPILLEVGPGATLTRFARQQITQQQSSITAIASLPDAGKSQDDLNSLQLALAELWSAGHALNWEKIQGREQKEHTGGASRPRRLSLPVYPFERESYWIAPEVMPSADLQAKIRPESSAASLHYAYRLWQRPLKQPSTTSTPQQAVWLVFTENDFSDALMNKLPDFVEPIWVQPGNHYEKNQQHYLIDPDNAEHYAWLFQSLSENNKQPIDVINAFGLCDYAESCLSSIDKPGRVFSSTLFIAQQLKTAIRPLDTTLNILSGFAQNIIGDESCHVINNMVSGLCTVLPQELVGLRCRLIDVATAEKLSDQDIDRLFVELKQPCKTSVQLAIRHGKIWEKTYQKVDFEQPILESDIVKEEKTYLISGDLVDGLGLIYAHYLRSKNARLILIGRPGLPQPEDWEKWLATYSADHAVSQMILTLQGLGKPGEDYMFYSGNLANADWLENSLAEGVEKLGLIHGVFHTAAMGDETSCLLEDIDESSCQSLFDTKIVGLQTLKRIVEPCSPEFFMVQSSLSSLVGGVGLSAYAAANAYLDAKVEQWAEQSSTTRFYAVNWDVVQQHNTSATGGSQLMASALTPDEVWHVTQLLLTQGQLAGSVAVSKQDIQTRIAQSLSVTPDSQVDSVSPISLAENGALTIYPRPALSTDYVAPTDEIETTVCQVMADLLGLEQVGLRDNFFELGGHSLLAVQAVTQMRKRYDVDIPMRSLLFEDPTAEGIARIIKANNSVDQADSSLSDEDQSLIESLLDEIEGSAEA